ncbi:unnamed protein product [marine sediment metagenome]|uniref:Uncharacterized protein n=1 Tax=marine sediment metagenome TaxID=412755 RepID=X0UNB2_9ZZZZ
MKKETKLWQWIFNWELLYDLISLAVREEIDAKELIICADKQGFDIYRVNPLELP